MSMNVAGRKRPLWISMPGRPGRISSIAFSTPFVTSSVLASGSFWTTSIRPSRWSMAASPHNGHVVLDDVADVRQPHHPAVALLDRHLREVVLGLRSGCTLRTFMRPSLGLDEPALCRR